MDWQLEQRQREKEKKERPWDVKGEYDQDESREAFDGGGGGDEGSAGSSFALSDAL